MSYKSEFNKLNYDRVAFDVKKGTKEELKEIAKIKNKSLNEYIRKAVQQQYYDDTGEKLDL